MLIERKWSFGNKWTFTIRPIKKLLSEEVTQGLWCDPFCGLHSPAQVTNDINPDIKATSNKDALEFLKELDKESFDGVLLDPPYSHRQVSEHYKKAGVKVTGWHTSSAWQCTIKDQAHRILKPGGKVICFGWDAMGLGTTRGYEMTRMLVVPHAGGRNATIVTVELKK